MNFKKFFIFIFVFLILIIGDESYSDKLLLKTVDYKNNCYADDTDIKQFSYYTISNIFSDDVYKKQRRLSIEKFEKEVIVTGHTRGRIREFETFGGGGVVLIFKRDLNCLTLEEYYISK